MLSPSPRRSLYKLSVAARIRGDDGLCLAEVGLRLTQRVRQGDEHLPAAEPGGAQRAEHGYTGGYAIVKDYALAAWL